MGPYPYGTYYGGLDFVDYGIIPGCIDNGDRIPDKLYMLLAYMRDGDPLTPGKINPTTLKLDGEGPYRLIPPQKIAGSPGQEESVEHMIMKITIVRRQVLTDPPPLNPLPLLHLL